jgi:DNA polymerase-3 subunit gamma/tau
LPKVEKPATPTLPKLPETSKLPETPKLPDFSKPLETPKLPETPKIPVPDSGKAKSTVQLPKFGELKGGPKEEQKPVSKLEEKPDKPFTSDELRATWKQYAETRKMYQAEYYLLSQEVEIRGQQVIVHLHNSFQETLINTIKAEALAFLREKLENNSIQLFGELTAIDDSKKVIYTNKEKFDHLAEKNPKLKEMKDRLGLDTEF